MKKKVLFSIICYCVIMMMSMIYCRPEWNELGKMFLHSIMLSAVILCVLIAVFIFSKSISNHIYFIIPNYSFPYLVCFMIILLTIQSIIQMIKSSSISNALWFLPCAIVFLYIGYLRKEISY